MTEARHCDCGRRYEIDDDLQYRCFTCQPRPEPGWLSRSIESAKAATKPKDGEGAEALLACPFCGGAVEIVQIGNEVTPKRGFEVRCLTWGCATKKRAMVIRQPLEKARGFAISAWNRRAPPAIPVRGGGGEGSSNASRAAMGPSAHSAPEAEPSAAWRPIETAPKDGTWVGGWVVFAGNDYSPDPFERFTVMYWREENRTPRFERKAGWEATWIGEPTHWMSLPEAPR